MQQLLVSGKNLTVTVAIQDCMKSIMQFSLAVIFLLFILCWNCYYSAVATSPVVLRWLCCSPRTGCARRTKIYMRGASKQ